MKRYLAAIISLLLVTGCADHNHLVRSGRYVVISLEEPQARHVFFASSLDGYELHEVRHSDGRWAVPMPAGVSFRYFFTVDGRVHIPPCRLREHDDYGSENCIYEPGL